MTATTATLTTMAMRRTMRATLLTTTVVAAAACRAEPTPLPFYQGADLTPEWIAPGAPPYDGIHRTDEFSLQDQTGATVTAADIDGKISVASFFFTSCTTVCPILRSNLGAVQGAFLDADDVVLLSFSVSPDTDTPAALADYARHNGIVPGKWHLLTGDLEHVTELAETSYFVELDDATGNTAADLLHTETLVLVDGQRRIRGVYNGTLPYEVAQLIEDILTLRREAG